MLNKISKEGEYRFHNNRTDAEEFSFRIKNLDNCIRYYTLLNQTPHQLAVDLKRIDVNATCSRQMNQLKDFINTTGAYYENTYSPLTYELMNLISNKME